MSTFDKQTKGESFFKQRDEELDTIIDPATKKIKIELTNRVDCLVCRADNYQHLFTKNGFDFVRCNECDHVYVNPQIKESATIEHYNEESKTNDSLFDFLSSPKHQEVRGALYEYFFEQIKNVAHGKKLLDIGCSIGQFSKMAKDRGYEPLGLELNEKAAKYAEDINGIKVERKLLNECNFSENSFDLITMFGVIEHLVSPTDVMSDIYRILKPGGMFLGICPNVQSLVCMILHEQSRTFTGRLHLSYFSEKTMRRLFVNSGFKNDNIEISNKYTGKNSLLNYFQFLDPFGDEISDYLPEKFKKFIIEEDNEKVLEEKMNELGIGLKLIFIARK